MQILGGFLLGIGIAAVVLSRLSHSIIAVPHESMYDLVEKIYHRLDKGASNEEIISGLSFWERRLVKKYYVRWDNDIFPVTLPQGQLVNKYYPVDHVVVYTERFVDKKDGREFGVYISGRFWLQRWRVLDELKSLLDVSRYGTFEILQGSISSVEDCADVYNPTDCTQIYSYLLLKNLINGSEQYLSYAILLTAHGDYTTTTWVQDVLNASVISPELPEIDISLGEEKKFHEALNDWYKTNAGKIAFDNSFLFYSDKGAP